MNLSHSNSCIRSSAFFILEFCLFLLMCGLAARGDDATTNAAPKPHWESVASADLALTRGNSDSLLATISLNTTRKWTNNEVLFGAAAGFGNNTTKNSTGENVTSETQDYVKGFGQWNHLFTERLYAGARVDGIYDHIAGINYRFTVSPLAGYYLVKETNTFLSGEIGPSFIFQQLAGEPPDSYVGLRLAQRFEHKFKGGARLWESLEWIPQVDKFDNWILNAEAGVSAPVTKSLDVRLVAQDGYNNEPASGKLKNDFKLMAGIGYRF